MENKFLGDMNKALGEMTKVSEQIMSIMPQLMSKLDGLTPEQLKELKEKGYDIEQLRRKIGK